MKIGIATRVRGRLQSIRTSSAVPVSLAYRAAVGGDAVALERRAHEILSSARLSGEWFSVSPHEAVQAVLQAAREMGFDLDESAKDPLTKKQIERQELARKRGRPPTGAKPIMVRVAPDQLARIATWIAKQPDQPSEPEAIRRLVEKGLGEG